MMIMCMYMLRFIYAYILLNIKYCTSIVEALMIKKRERERERKRKGKKTRFVYTYDGINEFVS